MEPSYNTYNTDELIDLVRKHAVLYDVSHPDYVKMRLKADIWTRIAKKLNMKDGTYNISVAIDFNCGAYFCFTFFDKSRQREKELTRREAFMCVCVTVCCVLTFTLKKEKNLVRKDNDSLSVFGAFRNWVRK